VSDTLTIDLFACGRGSNPETCGNGGRFARQQSRNAKRAGVLHHFIHQALRESRGASSTSLPSRPGNSLGQGRPCSLDSWTEKKRTCIVLSSCSGGCGPCLTQTPSPPRPEAGVAPDPERRGGRSPLGLPDVCARPSRRLGMCARCCGSGWTTGAKACSAQLESPATAQPPSDAASAGRWHTSGRSTPHTPEPQAPSDLRGPSVRPVRRGDRLGAVPSGASSRGPWVRRHTCKRPGVPGGGQAWTITTAGGFGNENQGGPCDSAVVTAHALGPELRVKILTNHLIPRWVHAPPGVATPMPRSNGRGRCAGTEGRACGTP
jgi:hypothetical protein